MDDCFDLLVIAGAGLVGGLISWVILKWEIQ